MIVQIKYIPHLSSSKINNDIIVSTIEKIIEERNPSMSVKIGSRPKRYCHVHF